MEQLSLDTSKKSRWVLIIWSPHLLLIPLHSALTLFPTAYPFPLYYGGGWNSPLQLKTYLGLIDSNFLYILIKLCLTSQNKEIIIFFFQKWPKIEFLKKFTKIFFLAKMCAIWSNFIILSYSFLQTSLFW